MRYVTNIFLKGIGAVLPVSLTLYLVYWLGKSLEQILRPIIVQVTPQGFYWPGMGLVAGLLLLFAIGFLVDAWIVRRIFSFGEALLEKIPLIKSIYGGLRDFMTYFARMQKNKNLNNVVSVGFGEARLIGFLTNEEEHQNLPGDNVLNDLVSVYLPMSYQIGGFTVYVKRDALEPIDMPVEDAMRLVLTAGLAKSQRKDSDEPNSGTMA